MKINTILLLAFAFTCFQCAEKKENMAINNAETESSEATNDNVQDLQIIRGYSNEKSDPLNVKDVSLDGDILTITVSYSGGCEEHEFELIFNEMYKKSLPPQGTLFLQHKANGDSCRELVTEELAFDLSIIKETQNHVIFDLAGYKERIEYK